MKILNTIGKGFDAKAKQMLQKLGDVTYLSPTKTELEKCINNFDVVVVGLGLNMNKETIDKAFRLKIIATATTGLDHIDVVYAQKRGIRVISLKNDKKFLEGITGTAELAWGLLLSLVRKIPIAVNEVKKGNWERGEFVGSTLCGKTLGIVGIGRLGKMVARYGVAFGMKVIYFDPYVKKVACAKKVSLKTLMMQSDAVSIHVHLDDITRNLISRRNIELMKKNAVLINTSRGKIVNEKDVLSALSSRKIAGYATDVIENELSSNRRISKNYPLIAFANKHSNLLITPHIGGMTYESRLMTDRRIVELLARDMNSIR